MDKTCEVWEGESQCGRPAPGVRMSIPPHVPTAYETERTRIRICLLHAESWGRLYEVKEED